MEQGDEENFFEKIDHLSEDDGIKSVEESIKYNKIHTNETDDFTENSRTIIQIIKNYNYTGGFHASNSNINNTGSIIAGDQSNYSGQKTQADKDKSFDSSIESIFDSCKSRRSFIISLSVFNGCNYRLVDEASQYLQNIIRLQSRKEAEIENTSNLDEEIEEKKRSQWLKDISAHLENDCEVTECGKSPVKKVAFDDQETPETVLHHIWHERDVYAKAMLQWLFELGKHENSQIRLRAAATAGRLARYEFQPVRDQILLPWAKSESQSIQKLVGFALAVVLYDENEDVAQLSLNSIHYWSSLKNSVKLNQTAIFAYCSCLGQHFPEQALEDLRNIANSGNGILFKDIAYAVKWLFKQSSSSVLVLQSLNQWGRQEKKSSLHRLSLLIFSDLMRISWSIKDGSQHPSLLILAEEKAKTEELIVRLLQRVFDSEPIRRLALTEIFKWLKHIDMHGKFWKTLARILYDVSRIPRNRNCICAYLEKWSDESETSLKILTEIKNGFRS
ncbi:hypothetical protein [Candidatus Electronema sp. JM]|uniref:hypothetical protein n=1 Tax=Candidatus Electronema sp. JM TaxID=3401571 RepID=UPI003AA99455